MKRIIIELNIKLWKLLKKTYAFIMKKHKIMIPILFILLLTSVLFLIFGFLKYKKEVTSLRENNENFQKDNEKLQEKSDEVILPSKDDLRFKYNYISRDDYPYYFSEGKKWILESSYGEVEIDERDLFKETNIHEPEEDKFNSWGRTYLFYGLNIFDTIDFPFQNIQKMEFMDIDNDKNNELLVYYDTGTKERILQIYKLKLDKDKNFIKDFYKIENLRLSSSFQVRIDSEGYFIVKYNKRINNDLSLGLEFVTEKYLVQNNSFKLVSTESLNVREDRVKYFENYEEKNYFVKVKNEVEKEKGITYKACYDDLGRIVSFGGGDLDVDYEYYYYQNNIVKKIRIVSNFDDNSRRDVKEITFDINGKKIKEENYNEGYY